MTNPYPNPGAGVPLPAYSSSASSIYHRSSYASVAAGNAPPATSTFLSGRHGQSANSGVNTSAHSHNRGTQMTNLLHHQIQAAHGRLSRQPSRDMDVDRGTGFEAFGGRNGTVGRGQAQWSSQLGKYVDGLNCPVHDIHPPFFTPSYLRRSRHVERLERAHSEHIAQLQEELALHPPKPQPPPLSHSSSHSSLHKLPPAHQHHHRPGPVQDIIERIPPAVEGDKTYPLPSRWNEDDKQTGLEILADGTEVRFSGVTKNNDDAAAVRADHPMPKECGLYYFEVTILSRGKDGLIGIGFSGKRTSLNRLPGWEGESWAYHGDDGFTFQCTASGKAYGPRFSSLDVIGCGVNFKTGSAFFTRNGIYLGVAFHGIKGDKLYASVGMKKPGEHLRINFGHRPFVFDIDSMMERERQSIFEDIKKADPSVLHPPDDESTLIHGLIGQYLAHEGYVETSKAFTRDVREQQQSLSTESQPIQMPDSDDDVHAINRQKIRKAILDGHMDKALKYTTSYYPRVLEDERNKDIYFRLRCRKFIEMMRRCTELQGATNSPTVAAKLGDAPPSNGNGHVESAEGFGGVDGVDDEDGEDEEDGEDKEDELGQQMELDDQLQREANLRPSKTLNIPNTDDVDMDASQELHPPTTAGIGRTGHMKYNSLLHAAIQYGSELKQEFGSDSRPHIEKQLYDMFAIVAYANPEESVVGSLMDPRGRVQISEEVNGAILVSLGKPSSAALEKLCAQTETFLQMASEKSGGAAAMLNLRKDIMER